MKTFTIQVSSEFAQQLGDYTEELPRLLELGLRFLKTSRTTTQPVVVKTSTELPERKKEMAKGQETSLKTQLLTIGKRCAALPVIDNRSPEDILGYADQGMSTS